MSIVMHGNYLMYRIHCPPPYPPILWGCGGVAPPRPSPQGRPTIIIMLKRRQLLRGIKIPNFVVDRQPAVRSVDENGGLFTSITL